MARPAEYQNLIKTRAFEAVQATPGAVAGYLRNAGDYLDAAKSLNPEKTLQVFTMAYEGYYAIVQALLEFHEVRTREAGRNLAILRVSQDLKLSSAEREPFSRAPLPVPATPHPAPGSAAPSPAAAPLPRAAPGGG